jgi:hypothetical protein
MLDILITLVLALVGWKLASLIRIPAPAMIGPMVFIAVASVIWGVQVQLHPIVRIVIQSLIGGYIGRRISLQAIRALIRLLPTILMTTFWYGLATAVIGYGVARWAFIDLGSAFLATAPGGVAEMTALAMVSQVDVAFVATLQTLRVLASNITIPIIAKFAPAPTDGDTMHSSSIPSQKTDQKHQRLRLPWIGTVVVGLIGSFLFAGLRIPAGGMLGGMVAIALLQMRRVSVVPVPKIVLTGTYMILGISVGSSFDLATLQRLQGSLGILVGATIATLISSIVLSLVVMQLMHIDLKTSLLACSPGGLSIMAVVAEETGAKVEIVSLLHLVRIIWVVVSMPIFMSIFL